MHTERVAIFRIFRFRPNEDTCASRRSKLLLPKVPTGASEVASLEAAETLAVAMVSVATAGDAQILTLSSRYKSEQGRRQCRTHLNREEAYKFEVRPHLSVLSHSR